MNVQLWSSHYAPQPTGIGPIATTMASELAARGHRVEVVAAHPYYPERRWGTRTLPYRERVAGLPVLRLPLLGERRSVAGRVLQEGSFAAAATLAAPLLPRPDVVLAASPAFIALGPLMTWNRVRRTPWVLWLQDILPDGATATGLVREGRLIEAARRFELRAYAEASHIVAISDSFVENLAAKGVPREKLTRVYNPATRPFRGPLGGPPGDGRTVLTMGNIGFTQNLEAVTRAFQSSVELESLGAKFVMAGDGVEGARVRAAITSDRVRVTGLLDPGQLEAELGSASLAVVSQRYANDTIDFNVPSKLMNFMASGLPVVAVARRNSEVARLVEKSGGGWVTDDLERGLTRLIAGALRDPQERLRRSRAGLDFARKTFRPSVVGGQMESVLSAAAG